MPRKNQTTEYEITVGQKTFFRIGRWDADMEATRQRKLNPGMTVTVKRCVKPKSGSPGPKLLEDMLNDIFSK